MSSFDIELDGLGKLEDSLEDAADNVSGQYTGVAGTSKEYAPYVEFGRGPVTPTDAEALRFRGESGEIVFAMHADPVPPQPFMRPALRDTRSNLDDVIREAKTLEQAILLAGTDIVEGASRRVPVETGDLKASIGFEFL